MYIQVKCLTVNSVNNLICPTFFLQNERGIFKLNVSLDNCIFSIREFSAHLHNYLNAGIITWLTLNHMT